MKINTTVKRLLSLVAIAATLVTSTPIAHADPLDTLRNAISGKKNDIQSVDQEIQQLQVQVNEKGNERKTLQQVVNELSSRQSSLLSKINSAESSIGGIESNIQSIDSEINVLESQIEKRKTAVQSNLQQMQIIDGDSLIEGLLRHDSLSEFWQEADVSQQLSVALDSSMEEIRLDQNELESTKAKQLQERNRLVALRESIAIDKQSIDIARAEQDRLLGITRNEEKGYQQLLAEKKKLKAAFEADMLAYEAQLNIAINPASVPVAASATLSWPLSSVSITQYFGNTAFAQSGAYNGSGHNGIDLDLEVGTPVMSARQGTVKGVGNTDAQCPNASFGNWILVEHDNGLSTLYAHLSQVSVSTGQAVTRGQVIGYGGNTGYSTGSHLHFTVYASQGVRVGGLPSRSCPGTTITLPLADLSAYLNPMQYLP